LADTSPKKKVAAKPKKPAAHPKYSEMVGKAIAALKERGGSSSGKVKLYFTLERKAAVQSIVPLHSYL
jgi:hypothetical protein